MKSKVFYLILLSVSLAVQTSAAPLLIDVVYPRVMPGDSVVRVARVDSTFTFGSVRPTDAVLMVNGQPMIPDDDGVFLAWIPVDWITGRFVFEAHSGDDTARVDLPFAAPPPAPLPAKPQIVFPKVVTLSGGAARTHPRGAYYLFPDSAVQAVVADWKDGYYEIPIDEGRSVWIEDKNIIHFEPSAELPPSVIWRIDSRRVKSGVEVSLPVGRRLLYRISDEGGSQCINLDLYGAVSHIDLITQPPGTEFIHGVAWNQPSPTTLRLRFHLKSSSWGFKPRWDGGKLTLFFREPPHLEDDLRGITVAIDPGHGGGQPGAIGPSRLQEKDLNLSVALALARILKRSGAEIVLTRESDAALGLSERIEIAEAADADLLVSIHHNALPDGVNPFGNFGTTTYYYHAQSIGLAAALQREVVEVLGFPDEGIGYNNLALVRPTAMPAALIEAGHIMLPEQERVMMKRGYPTKLARAIARGIRRYLDGRADVHYRYSTPDNEPAY